MMYPYHVNVGGRGFEKEGQQVENSSGLNIK